MILAITINTIRLLERDNSTQFSVETGKEGLERCEQVGKTN